jgi:hypothetical protein
MSYPVYYPISGDTLPILFNTFGASNEAITLTGLAVTDIEIYKDGSTTQRSSDSGFTLLDTDGIDFDSTTGIHGFSIDLSDNTDSGFFTVGPWYHIVVASTTVNSQTVNFVAAAFRILDATRGLAGTALPNAAADAAGGVPISDAGGLDLDAKLANTNEVTAARMGALTDWINGGRLDLLLDAILVDTAVIGAAGAGLTAIPWNAVWDAEVQSEVQDAIEANHLDHLLAVDYDPASKPGTATALLNELVESDGGVSRYTANALEQGAGGGTTNVRQESSFLQGGKS